MSILTPEQIYLAKERRRKECHAIDEYIKSLHMEDHEFKHHNDALGVDIESKEHYKEVMLRGGFIPYEKAIKMALTNKTKHKVYEPSPLLKNFLRHLYSKPRTKNGEIKLSGREIETMKEIGVNFDQFMPEGLRKSRSMAGGFC